MKYIVSIIGALLVVCFPASLMLEALDLIGLAEAIAIGVLCLILGFMLMITNSD